MLDLSKFAGARRAIMPVKFTPMLASLPEGSFSKAGWIYEPKMDGMRAIAIVKDGSCQLVSRRALPISNQYPSLAEEIRKLTICDAIIDGEIIALNELGRPSFQHLQQRMNLIRQADINRAEQAVPAYYFVFDLVYAAGYDLCGMKLSERKAILKEVLQQSDKVRHLTHFTDDGVAAYEVCVDNGFEGIVAKRLESPYEPGRRSAYWTKVKAQQTDEFVVGGFTAGTGSRSPTFGALLLGAYDESNNFVYCGSVGTGFDERLLREMLRRMEPLKQPKHPFLKRPDEKKDVTWLSPQIVVEIKFMDWTRDGHLRTPVFLRVRDDKGKEEIRLDRRAPTSHGLNLESARQRSLERSKEPITHIKSAIKAAPQSSQSQEQVADCIPVRVETPKQTDAPKRRGRKTAERTEKEEHPDLQSTVQSCHDVAAQLAVSIGEKTEVVVDGDIIEFTHLDKILWPSPPGSGLPKLTKRDLIRYVALVAPYSLPYLKDRPFTVVRSPYGMKGKRFYQKHWNFQIPDFVETCFVERDHDEDTEVAMCNNFASLLWFTQHSVMEQHVWLSRITTDDAGTRPDFMVFDLDHHFEDEAKEARLYRHDAFLRVSEAAHWLKEALDSVSLTAYLKTSGRNGMHVFVPIETTLLHEEVRMLAETISKFILNKHGDKVTIDAVAAKRDGKILLDCSPNCKGKTLVAPYSPRLVKEQTVSTPLRWSELGQIAPPDLTMSTVPQRLSLIGNIWQDWQLDRKSLEQLLGKR